MFQNQLPRTLMEVPRERSRQTQHQQGSADHISRGRSLEDDSQNRELDRHREVTISREYLRSLEKQVKSDNK
jgi:hypothetical protein